MAIPKIVKPVGQRRPEITWITIDKEYEVIEFVPPALCWIKDDEGDSIAIIVPALHPEASVGGGHHGRWEVVA